MLDIAVSEPSSDVARRDRILEGAAAVFLAYGFQRTTMEDIAKASEVSRPALYLQFRNKSDIYRALAADFLRKFLDMASLVLDGEGDLSERICGAVDGTLCMILDVEKSAHGAEILDMKNSLAADVVADGRRRMKELFEGAIARAIKGKPADSDMAGLLADLILDALDGMRMRNLPADTQRDTVRRYVDLILAGVAS